MSALSRCVFRSLHQ